MSHENTEIALNAASWVMCSPHEWTWTVEQQAAMARYCLVATAVLSEAARDLEKIVCVKEPDRGVIFLSNDSPTHYDAEAGGHIYEHENFSPLGDALIALHDHLSSLQLPLEPANTLQVSKSCRRCSDCVGSEHHWTENPDMCLDGESMYVCKHCEAKGNECDECDGLGVEAQADEDCKNCRGHGIVRVNQ